MKMRKAESGLLIYRSTTNTTRKISTHCNVQKAGVLLQKGVWIGHKVHMVLLEQLIYKNHTVGLNLARVQPRWLILYSILCFSLCVSPGQITQGSLNSCMWAVCAHACVSPTGIITLNHWLISQFSHVISAPSLYFSVRLAFLCRHVFGKHEPR